MKKKKAGTNTFGKQWMPTMNCLCYQLFTSSIREIFLWSRLYDNIAKAVNVEKVRHQTNYQGIFFCKQAEKNPCDIE